MKFSRKPPLGKIYKPIVTAVTVVFVFFVGFHDLRSQAQLTNDQAVVYKQCLTNDGSLQFGRFPECGVDVKATAANRKKLEELERRAQRARRPLTPEQEQKVQQHLDKRFGVQHSPAQDQVKIILETAETRIERVLANEKYEFTTREQDTLQNALNWTQERRSLLAAGSLSKQEIRELRTALGEQMGVVASLVIAKQRSGAISVPQVENLVTRIDDLVTRVGTVIRDVDRSGVRVPSNVRTGHRSASDLVAQAKRTCSTSRPAGCTQLRQVLETIEGLKEPLCQLDSPALTFCN